LKVDDWGGELLEYAPDLAFAMFDAGADY